MSLDIIFRDRLYEEYIRKGNTFHDIAYKHPKFSFEENELFYFNMIFVDNVFSRGDYQDSWEDYELYSFSTDFFDPLSPLMDLRKRLEAGRFYYEDRGASTVIRKNGISTFREKECVICKEAIPNIMFCNCGHIIICEECDKLNFEKCLFCKTTCQIKCKL